MYITSTNQNKIQYSSIYFDNVPYGNIWKYIMEILAERSLTAWPLPKSSCFWCSKDVFVWSSPVFLGTSQLLVDYVRISCRDCSWRLQYTGGGCTIFTNPFLPLMLRGFMWDMWLKYQLLISCFHGVVRSYTVSQRFAQKQTWVTCH